MLLPGWGRVGGWLRLSFITTLVEGVLGARSKSLESRGVEFDVVHYLKTPPGRGDLERFLELLPGKPAELVREDSHFKQLGLRIDDYETPEAVVELLLEHPKLMQRPVVVRGNRAVIARPPKLVEELL